MIALHDPFLASRERARKNFGPDLLDADREKRIFRAGTESIPELDKLNLTSGKVVVILKHTWNSA
jgi:hypothetical protein